LESQWRTTEAQLDPLPNPVLDTATMDRFLRERNVVYAGGFGGGNAVYVAVPSVAP